MNEQVARKYCVAVQDLLDAMGEMSQADVNNLAGQVVTLRDTNRFVVPLELLTRQEVQEARRELAAAIAAEKWLEGFVTAVQLMLLLFGI